MAELIGRYTKMPVDEVEENTTVEANRVYIIPPNKYMTIHDGVLRLTGPVERRGLTTIDLFLRSLAEDQQEKAICIILSGTGPHGALGLKAIKTSGGMAMVQEPKTAEYPRMPESAVATGLADYILPVEQMPEALLKYVQHFCVNGQKPIEAVPEAADLLTQVLALLRARTKFDFRCYRKRMLGRRIQRRMGLNHFNGVADYVAFLREHPDEVKHLAKDLLISVTSFFRDPEAFQALEKQVIAPLIEGKENDEPVRVWVPGCATGEEAYSVAMLLHEHLAETRKDCRLQIFATDVDEEALDIARQGVYPDSITADVAPERLVRFFTPLDEHTYQVKKQLRESLVIAVQNLISDAPFTKLDLISCRNLLIYLEPEVQKKVISLLHFSLNQGGHLFLGPSETIGRQIDLFDPLSKKWRIYKRIGPSRPEQVDFPIVQATDPRSGARRLPEPVAHRPINLASVAQQLLAETFAPASVLINRNYEVLYFHGPTSRYLEQPSGEPTKDLLSMAREGLRAKLRAAVHKCVRDNATIVVSDVHLKRNGNYCTVQATVRPVHAPRVGEGLLLITFKDMAEAVPVRPAGQGETVAEETTIHQLEYELQATREDLQSSIEELESANEELKASNEEVMSMNEELQSANEELETSKEELQSLNEELTTVNNQLQEKVDEFETANNDMANLLNCTDVGTIFLDARLRIKRFTPAATRMFNLISTDVGRPIADITPKFADDDLLSDAERVLRSLTLNSKEVRLEDGGWSLRRIVPYRTLDNRIEGIVITFLEFTELKDAREALAQQVDKRSELSAVNVHLREKVNERLRAEQSLRERESRLLAILDSPDEAIIAMNPHGLIDSANQGAERIFGYSARELIGRNVKVLMPEPYASEHDGYLQTYLRTGVKKIIGIGRELMARRKDGTVFPIDLAISETPDHRLFIGIIRDITRRKQLEREVVEIAALEQRRIGQDLHDTVSQDLAAMAMDGNNLLGILGKDPSAAEKEIRQMVARLNQALAAVRQIARGLMPVQVNAEGLMAALRELAELVHEKQLTCTFDCPSQVLLKDPITATHLFYIAKEAVNNARKHAGARHIRILLEGNEHVALTVADDGEGIVEQAKKSQGLGIRIMQNRAGIIGGRLSIQPGKQGGTVVRCILPKEILHEPGNES